MVDYDQVFKSKPKVIDDRESPRASINDPNISPHKQFYRAGKFTINNVVERAGEQSAYESTTVSYDSNASTRAILSQSVDYTAGVPGLVQGFEFNELEGAVLVEKEEVPSINTDISLDHSSPTPKLIDSTSQLFPIDESDLKELENPKHLDVRVQQMDQKIQVLARQMINLRDVLNDIFEKQKHVYLPFIIKIQAAFRGYLVRKQLKPKWTEKLKAKKLSALTFENFYSDCMLIQGFPSQSTNDLDVAATKIQAAWRGKMVRYRCEKYSIGYFSALQIQSLWRGYSARKANGNMLQMAKMQAKLENQSKEIEYLKNQMEIILKFVNKN